jgi:hypothetical protein
LFSINGRVSKNPPKPLFDPLPPLLEPPRLLSNPEIKLPVSLFKKLFKPDKNPPMPPPDEELDDGRFVDVV